MSRTSFIEHFSLADDQGRDALIATFGHVAPSPETAFLKGESRVDSLQHPSQHPLSHRPACGSQARSCDAAGL